MSHLYLIPLKIVRQVDLAFTHGQCLHECLLEYIKTKAKVKRHRSQFFHLFFHKGILKYKEGLSSLHFSYIINSSSTFTCTT